jgi:hypothetical protein
LAAAAEDFPLAMPCALKALLPEIAIMRAVAMTGKAAILSWGGRFSAAQPPERPPCGRPSEGLSMSPPGAIISVGFSGSAGRFQRLRHGDEGRVAAGAADDREADTGRPSIVAPGRLTCGMPASPPWAHRQRMRSRCALATDSGSPRFGAGNGVVGRQRMVPGGKPANDIDPGSPVMGAPSHSSQASLTARGKDRRGAVLQQSGEPQTALIHLWHEVADQRAVRAARLRRPRSICTLAGPTRISEYRRLAGPSLDGRSSAVGRLPPRHWRSARRLPTINHELHGAIPPPASASCICRKSTGGSFL